MPVSHESGADAPMLVTGATGFIGGRLALRLLEQGHRPRLLVRDPGRLHPRLREGAQVLRGDLLEPASLLPAVQGCARVFHCAANVATWDRAEAYEAANVDGVRNLLRALAAQGPEVPAHRAHRVHLVHLSTVDVYGYPRQPADEAAPCEGGDFGYGRSKARGEALLRAEATRLGLSWCVLRPANVMGPGSPFIQRIGDELRAGLMLRVGGGRADCGFLDIDNLLDVMLWAAQAPEAHQGVFNVRDPLGISWARFLADLRAGIGGKGLVLDLPEPLAEAAARLLQAGHRLLRLRGEPLLHPLLVRMFARSCGHSIERLRAAGAPLGAVGYEAAMQRSTRWYLDQRSGHARG